MLFKIKLHIFKALAATAIIAMTASTTMAMTGFTVNGSPAHYDATWGTFLVTVPQECFSNNLEATINSSDNCHVIEIDNAAVADDGFFTFSNISPTSSWAVKWVNKQGDTLNSTLEFTHLPIVQLEGNPGYEYSPTAVTLTEPGKGTSQPMTAKVKWRGNTTNMDGKYKRNYSIKFVYENGDSQNRKLLNMRRDNHWILDAGQADMARVRNRVATELWLDMSPPPYYYDQAPDVLTGARGEMVEVFLGDNYRGIYALTEAMDRKQMQLVKHDTINNVFHGGLWKTSEYNSYTGFRDTIPFDESKPAYRGFVTEYPDFEEVHPTSYQVLYDAIDAMVRSESLDTFNLLFEQHFDVPVMIDYVIFVLTLNANDNEPRNIFWAVWDRQIDKRLTLGAWDLDATVGQSWSLSEAWRPPIVAPDFLRKPYCWMFKFLMNYKCKFNKDFLDRYHELRQSWLSYDALASRYCDKIDLLINCGAAAREMRRWNVPESDTGGHLLNFEEEKQYICQWFATRLPLLDKFVEHHACDTNDDGVVNAADITKVYNNILFEQDFDTLSDVNYDGYINAADITCIYNFILFGE